MMKKCTTKAPSATVLTVMALLACQPLAAYAGRITMHLRIEIEKQTRKADKIAALAAERAARAGCLAVDSPRHIQQNQRRVRNVEQQHYGVSARAVQRKQR
ncbi:TPA: hypothetical protein MG598_28005 [Klebsiella pneumoniae]|nr:hypothetical protein [Klebsiella pneumoniae]HBZ4113176.1 hypothetical protein [Klebsiella pneumoniae]HBZ4121433.1 hypothetical protein [Klebsiella pneumoniae]HBZ4124364.1 hypothetical protein [Klebsiella pneumoniae]